MNFQARIPENYGFMSVNGVESFQTNSTAAINELIERVAGALNKYRIPFECETVKTENNVFHIVKQTGEPLPKTRNGAPRKKTIKTGIKCEQLSEGRYLWTHPSGYQSISPIPHDEKHYNKIMAEARARIDRNLLDKSCAMTVFLKA